VAFLSTPFDKLNLNTTLTLILGLLFIYLLFGFFILREYKTFYLDDTTLKIGYTFLKVFKTTTVKIDDIESIRIIKYSLQNRLASVMLIDYCLIAQSQRVKILFRIESKRVEFQDLINLLRFKGVEVHCEGDVWI
jgi:hypothetical protein